MHVITFIKLSTIVKVCQWQFYQINLYQVLLTTDVGNEFITTTVLGTEYIGKSNYHANTAMMVALLFGCWRLLITNLSIAGW